MNYWAPWRRTILWQQIAPPGRVVPPGYYYPTGPCVPNGPIVVNGPFTIARPMDSPPVYPGGPLMQGLCCIPRALLAPGGPVPPVAPPMEPPRGQVVAPGTVGAPTQVPAPGYVPDIVLPHVQMMARTEAVRVAIANCAVVRTLVDDFGTTSAGTIYDRGVANAGITSAWSVFDTSVGANLYWAHNPSDTVTGNVFATQLLKTGALLSANYGSLFNLLPPNQSFLLPNAPQQILARPNVGVATFFVTQPLLQGAGQPVNMAPIVIAKTSAAQSVWDFKTAMLALIRSVETTYWDLSAAAAQLDVVNTILPRYEEVIRVARSRGVADAATRSEVSQAETRYWEFRRVRLDAQINLANQEALLRNVLGLPPPPMNVPQIRPADPPTRARVVFDWDATMNTAYRERPDISRQRLNVYIRRQELLIAENSFLPQFNATALWQPNGLGQQLSNAATLSGDQRFSEWAAGFNFNMPLQRRLARGGIRAAQLNLAKERSLLNQTTHSATHNIARLMRELYILHDQAQVAERARDAAKVWADGARANFLEPRGEVTEPLGINLYLQALRAWNESWQQAIAYRAQYNIQLALIGEAVGTLLNDYNISLYGDPSRQVDATIGPCDASQLLNSASGPSDSALKPTIQAPPAVPSAALPRVAASPRG
jgi:outer membrane protein TolC